MLVRNQYIYLKTTIEENEQKITVSNSIVRLCYKIGVLCLVRLYTSKDPKHDHKALDFIRTNYSRIILFFPFRTILSPNLNTFSHYFGKDISLSLFAPFLLSSNVNCIYLAKQI